LFARWRQDAFAPTDQTIGHNQATPQDEKAESSVELTPPKIVSRQEWGARDVVGKMRPNAPRYITIHHTASPQKPAVAIERRCGDLQAFSQTEIDWILARLSPHGRTFHIIIILPRTARWLRVGR